MDPGDGVEEPKDIEKPQDDPNDHDGIQDGLDGPRHGNEAVHQPEQNTDYDQNHYQLK